MSRNVVAVHSDYTVSTFTQKLMGKQLSLPWSRNTALWQEVKIECCRHVSDIVAYPSSELIYCDVCSMSEMSVDVILKALLSCGLIHKVFDC